jgi:hypothetical protein
MRIIFFPVKCVKTVAIVNVGPKDVTFRCKIDDFFKIRLISFVHVLCPGEQIV